VAAHVRLFGAGTTPEAIYDVEDEELIPVMRDFLEKRRAVAGEAAQEVSQ
jgi:hypothetical protein